MIKRFLRALQYFLPLSIAITLICGLIYVVVHQSYRQSANDPQIQIAEDTASFLEKGYPPEGMIPVNNKVDMGTGLAPYVIIYDETGKVLASSVTLDGKTPELPGGVFDFVRKYGRDRFSWEPKHDVRSAVAIVPFGGAKHGFVLAGRSLREVEKREAILGVHIVLGWAATMAATFFASLVLFVVPAFLPLRPLKLRKRKLPWFSRR